MIRNGREYITTNHSNIRGEKHGSTSTPDEERFGGGGARVDWTENALQKVQDQNATWHALDNIIEFCPGPFANIESLAANSAFISNAVDA